MKRLFISLFTLTLLLLPSDSLFAANNTSFFGALKNLSSVEDHKAVQSFYGNAEFMEDEDHITAEYRVSISSTVDDGSQTNSFNRVSAFIKFVNHNQVNDATPFREMTMQANGEIVTRSQDDIYFKLNNFNIGLKEPLPFAVVDTENVMAMMDLYRGTWYHASANKLAADESGKIDVEAYMALEEQLKEDPKEAILGLSELAFHDSKIKFTEEEIGQFMNGLELILNSKIFTEREVVAGQNTGFIFFNLNKGAVLDWMGKIAKIFGENITAKDELMLRSALGKFSLSGIYRVDEIHDIIDNLLVRFKLHEAGPLLDLEFNYRFKLWDVDKENSVKVPGEYKEWEDVSGILEDDIYDENDWFIEP